MIYESYPWKEDLLQRKRQLLEYNTVEHFQKDEEEAYTVLEKAVFYSAFIIRKLLDCKTKMSDSADNYHLHITQFKPLGNVDVLHNHLGEKTHDWKSPEKRTVSGRDVCNWLIHSYSFSFDYDERGLVTGFFVTSENDRNQLLCHLAIKEWLEYMDFIANDSVVEMEYHYKPKIQDYVLTKKRGPMEWIDSTQFLEEMMGKEP